MAVLPASSLRLRGLGFVRLLQALVLLADAVTFVEDEAHHNSQQECEAGKQQEADYPETLNAFGVEADCEPGGGQHSANQPQRH